MYNSEATSIKTGGFFCTLTVTGSSERNSRLAALPWLSSQLLPGPDVYSFPDFLIAIFAENL